MWTHERTQLLRKLWAEGLSASQIAKQLGGVTRNAVIGKVHRLGLAGRATPSRPAARPVREVGCRTLRLPKPIIPTRHVTPEAPTPELDPIRALQPVQFEDGAPASTLTVSNFICRYPIGDPKSDTFAYCGRGVVCGPYCDDHRKLAYRPEDPERAKQLRRVALWLAGAGPGKAIEL
jgi:GcrA cell cycle regulator